MKSRQLSRPAVSNLLATVRPAILIDQAAHDHIASALQQIICALSQSNHPRKPSPDCAETSNNSTFGFKRRTSSRKSLMSNGTYGRRSILLSSSRCDSQTM